MLFERAKSDKADSELIRQYAVAHELELWVPSSEAINGLKQALSWIDDLTRENTMAANREEAMRHQVTSF